MPQEQAQETAANMWGREMNWSFAAGLAVVKAAASRRTPNWARDQEAESVRTRGAAVLRPYKCRNGGYTQGHARGFGMPAEDEAR